MLKNCVKKIVVLLLVIAMISSFSNFIYVAKAKASISSNLIDDLDKGNPNDSTATKVNKVVSTVITIARVIGVAVAIVMLLIVAMKYMTAAPGEKADIKKSAVVYVVGAIVLFAVSGILTIINTFSSSIKPSTP